MARALVSRIQLTPDVLERLPRTSVFEGLALDRFHELRDGSDRVVGVYGTRDIGRAFNHGAVTLVDPDGIGAVAASGPHYAYGLGGISTQQFARDLFAAGYAGSLFTLTSPFNASCLHPMT